MGKTWHQKRSQRKNWPRLSKGYPKHSKLRRRQFWYLDLSFLFFWDKILSFLFFPFLLYFIKIYIQKSAQILSVQLSDFPQIEHTDGTPPGHKQKVIKSRGILMPRPFPYLSPSLLSRGNHNPDIELQSLN